MIFSESHGPGFDLIVCAYTGPPGDCQECGFCSDGCRYARLDREDRHQAALQARRDAEDAFGRELVRPRSLGHTDEEIDEMLKDMP